MTTERITLDFIFEVQEEDGYTHRDLIAIERVKSDVPDTETLSIQECLTQSDRGWIELPGTVIEALSGGRHEL